MKTHNATSHNATMVKYIPETRITTMKYTSFSAPYRIKKDLQILSKGSVGYSPERFFNAGPTQSNLCRINPS